MYVCIYLCIYIIQPALNASLGQLIFPTQWIYFGTTHASETTG